MNSRRNFLRNLGATASISGIAFAAGSQLSHFNEEEKLLLTQFESWVDSYVGLITEEKAEGRTLKNNPKIMTLSTELEEWMPRLKKHFTNDTFSEAFAKISERLTNAVDASYIKQA